MSAGDPFDSPKPRRLFAGALGAMITLAVLFVLALGAGVVA